MEGVNGAPSQNNLTGFEAPAIAQRKKFAARCKDLAPAMIVDTSARKPEPPKSDTAHPAKQAQGSAKATTGRPTTRRRRRKVRTFMRLGFGLGTCGLLTGFVVVGSLRHL